MFPHGGSIKIETKSDTRIGLVQGL